MLKGREQYCVWTVGNSYDNDIYLLKLCNFSDTVVIAVLNQQGKLMLKDVTSLDKDSIPTIRCEKNIPFPMVENDFMCLGELPLYSVSLVSEARIKLEFKEFYEI